MSRTSNRRQFQWARASGTLGSQVGFAQRADLLDAVRTRYGAAYLRGATVMGIRGYNIMRPAAPEPGAFARGRIGIRVANLGDLAPGTPATAGSPFENPEARWMHFFQCTLSELVSAGGATSQENGNAWAVDVQSHRRMTEAGVTLLLQADFQVTTAATTEWIMDYDYSIGLKLA